MKTLADQLKRPKAQAAETFSEQSGNTRAAGRSAASSSSITFNGFGDRALIIVLLFITGVALVVSILAWGDSRTAKQSADIAERRANISELYAKQVFVELNRLGYPVKTPAEEHSVAPVEEP